MGLHRLVKRAGGQKPLFNLGWLDLKYRYDSGRRRMHKHTAVDTNFIWRLLDLRSLELILHLPNIIGVVVLLHCLGLVLDGCFDNNHLRFIELKHVR